MPVTMPSGSKRGKSLERLGPHRLSMIWRKKKRNNKKKRSKSLLTWSLIRLKRVQDRRRKPPQAEANKTKRIFSDLGLALPVSGMRYDPCLRDRGGYGWLRT